MIITAPAVSAQGTNVQVNICGAATITLEQPQSDSVVTAPSVTISGRVTQASQMEVLVNDQFDSVIPIALGQEEFTSTVTLAPGTHTIMVKAIDSCSGAPVTDASVVTYTPPPSTPSSGAATPTEVSGGVVIAPQGDIVPLQPEHTLLPGPLVDGWQRLLEWMNIAPFDTSEQTHDRLSFWGALLITAGVYLIMVGVGKRLLKKLTTLALLDRVKKKDRLPLTKRIVRFVGVVLIVVGLLL